MSAAVAERITDLFNGDMPDDANWLELLLKNRLDQLPYPGRGGTLERWKALAAVAEFDLSLTKLYEGHTDALAIIDELAPGSAATSSGAWCVWAAESPKGRALIHGNGSDVELSGSKHWCSGAITGDHALLTAWAKDEDLPHLISIDLDQPGIAIDSDKWKAVGMASSMSVNVAFDGAKGSRLGKAGQYLSRPGFWQGGAGIAACWYGGAVGIATALRKGLLESSGDDQQGYKLASLGKIDLALEETGAILRHAARWIDDHPFFDASQVALTARLSAEKCAKSVIDEVGKAMGATPFCLNEKFAKAAADLPVFIRQSHAEKDFAALGERSLTREAPAWSL
ncbi:MULTISPECIES: acyl-CoA dehydrogenase [Polaromonas]|uniref:Acyl-CoA dehydrogenase n=1 Tax=Polaromonas aquatica TaxID=332657 RepID=A0ABW1U7D7_9BURK